MTAHRIPCPPLLGALLAVGLCASPARAQLSFGVVGATAKVRPADRPQTATEAVLKAARNEFEAFQVVFTSSNSATSGVSVRLAQPLAGPGGAAIPAANVVLYRVAYYEVGTPSNTEGAAGPWPDPLIPDVDTYVGEKRDAFPFDVPATESRVVWVDLLVPEGATPGDYAGALEVLVGAQAQGTIPIRLRVGTFSLPSTASLRSAFGMDYASQCYAHTGYESCSPSWNEEAGAVLRERYVRSALEHRFTIEEAFFQPPMVSQPNEDLILPHVTGTAKATRLPGAKLTTVRIMTLNANEISSWIDYAKQHGFHERLFYYPVDEPLGSEWDKFSTEADKLHGIDPTVPVILTASIRDAEARGVADKVDIFVPVINHLEERPNAGTPYDGYQRPRYDAWLQARPGRDIWAYQSCMSHGCGDCGTPSTLVHDTGWPNRVIDATAVQTRAFPWIAFLFDLRGELYFAVAEQLTTAWEPDGQCAFSGSGDGTIFYPGTPAIIGGSTDIPVESIRMKLIREGMEDYEYLLLAASHDAAKARSIAEALFPHAYETNQPASRLEQARDQLFAILDEGGPLPPPAADGSIHAGDGGVPAGDGWAGDGDPAGRLQGGCAVGSVQGVASIALLTLLALLALLAPVCRLRRRCRGGLPDAAIGVRHHQRDRPGQPRQADALAIDRDR